MSDRSPDSENSPPLGVIEGFFGRTWSWKDRQAMMPFLAGEGFDFYLYAPKSDPYLRRLWQQHWPEPEWQQLVRLRQTSRQHRVRFGLGLSPLELYRESGPASQRQLEQKVLQLNDLQPDILCLLFDDMRGDVPHLAQRQAELARVAAATTNARQVILCPTYYSLDPVLEKVFGKRPERYWETLGRELPESIDIFWTGPQVCSPHYPEKHLREVSEWLRRKPFLWDNYPVNDGAAMSKKLPLMAYPPEHASLKGQVAGHAANPMNQAALSQIPLRSLPQVYREGEAYRQQQAFEQSCHATCSTDLARLLIADQPQLQERGLGDLSEPERQALLARYRPFAGQETTAGELVDWLEGGYAFDPACLTD